MPISISDLWLAILVSGVLCWIASALVHMLLKYHNSDYKKLSNEDQVSMALGEGSPAPGLYTLPHCIDMKEMAEESMQKKFNDGPVAMITVMPSGMPPMGKLMAQQVIFFIFGSLFVGYLTALSLSSETAYMVVFRHGCVASFLTYFWATIPYSIWMGQPWSNCGRYLLDSLIYSSVTAGAFAWLWP